MDTIRGAYNNQSTTEPMVARVREGKEEFVVVDFPGATDWNQRAAASFQRCASLASVTLVFVNAYGCDSSARQVVKSIEKDNKGCVLVVASHCDVKDDVWNDEKRPDATTRALEDISEALDVPQNMIILYSALNALGDGRIHDHVWATSMLRRKTPILGPVQLKAKILELVAKFRS